jgi:hypothetical protein
MSHAALFIACQTPERSGLPSAMRQAGRRLTAGDKATEPQALQRVPMRFFERRFDLSSCAPPFV